MSDTETQIAAKLAQSLPKEEPWTNGYPPDDKPTEPIGGVPFADYVMTNEILDYFGLSQGVKTSTEASAQLQEVIQWAKTNSESPDLAGILRTIRHTETILGSTLKGDRFARLYRYVRIQQQKAVLMEKERSLYI